jgi:hypothetical protein
MNDLVKRVGIDVAIGAGAIALWFATHKPEPPAQAPEVATPAPVIAKSEPIVIHPAAVQAYPDKVKQRTAIPSTMKADRNIAVLDSSTIAASERSQNVTTTLNTETGQVVTLVSENPAPWLAGESTGEARIDYGVKNGFRQVGRLSATEDLFQIKDVHLGISGSLETDGTYFMGAGISYRW